MKYLLPILVFAILFSCNNDQKKAEQTKFTNSNWKGSWERESWQNEASIDIISITGDSLIFHLLSSSGGNTGEIEGKALVNGNTATYYLADNYDTCSLIFKMFGDSLINLDQGKGKCFAAMGVNFAGDYYNSKYKDAAERARKNDNKEVSVTAFVNPAIFDNHTDDSIFRQLTGNDYDLFLNSTQLSSTADDLDNFNAKVTSSGVRGLFTFMENIIMIDSAHNIWAAVIDDNKVLYYSNNKTYKNKLPKTIEEWRSRFKDYPVIYKSEN